MSYRFYIMVENSRNFYPPVCVCVWVWVYTMTLGNVTWHSLKSGEILKVFFSKYSNSWILLQVKHCLISVFREAVWSESLLCHLPSYLKSHTLCMCSPPGRSRQQHCWRYYCAKTTGRTSPSTTHWSGRVMETWLVCFTVTCHSSALTGKKAILMGSLPLVNYK